MKAVTAYRLKLAAASTLAATTLVCGLAGALATSNPSLDLPLTSHLAPVAEARADAVAKGGTVAAALAANRMVIASQPMAASAWMRDAYIRTRDGAPIDDAGLAAIDNAYAVAPFGPSISSWRRAYLYEHWPELTPDLRREVTGELTLQLRTHGRGAFDPAVIANPSGRMAANMTVSSSRALARRAKAVPFSSQP